MGDQVGAQRSPEVVELSTVPDVYCNGVLTSVSGYDVLLVLQRHTPDAPEGGLIHETVAQVRLSHGLAWVTAHLILTGLTKLAKKEGLFCVPKDVLERLDLTEEYGRFVEMAK